MANSYKKNYLQQVIFRVDFDPIALGEYEEYKKSVPKYYDKRTVNKVKVANLSFSPDSSTVVNDEDEHDVWVFEDSKSGDNLNVTTNTCILEYLSYKDSSRLLVDVSQCIDTFLKAHKVKEVKRIGLRYVNEINPAGIKKLGDWATYIQPDLLAYSTFSDRGKTLTRVLNHVEFKTDELNVSFKYGIWNDKYPSPITNSPYILDIDCSMRLPVDLDDKDINDYAVLLGDEATRMFEDAITDKLRKNMEQQ